MHKYSFLSSNVKRNKQLWILILTWNEYLTLNKNNIYLAEIRIKYNMIHDIYKNVVKQLIRIESVIDLFTTW